MSIEQEPIVKKMRLEEPVNNTETSQTCKHFVVRKKRFCKMTVAKGKEYCGEHCPTSLGTSSENDEKISCDERIPCPLDSKHTVYKKNLRKHLRICNARPKDNPPDYIVSGINEGSDSEEMENDKQIENSKLSDLNEQIMDELITKIENLYNKYVKSTINELILEHEILSDELNNEKYGEERRKHLIQTSSILGYLKYYNMLQDSTSFIEFGAGKGQVAYWLAKTINDKKNSNIILIDRASHRHKKDNKIEDKTFIHRIRSDIKDFDIRKCHIINNSLNIVAISKHLCGTATDLTLRCLTLQNQNDDNKIKSKIKYFIIALCCHHRCEWKTFVGKKFFHENNLNANDFTIMIKMVSWAICGTGYSREKRKEIEEYQKEHEENLEKIKEKLPLKKILTRERKEEIGIMCKRIIDYSRLKFMRDNHFECNLNYYVSNSITLENVCLIGLLKE